MRIHMASVAVCERLNERLRERLPVAGPGRPGELVLASSAGLTARSRAIF